MESYLVFKDLAIIIVGCLTVELKKNLCRPHQTCIFLSNFLFYYIVFYSNI